jgi:hypothetical protein
MLDVLRELLADASGAGQVVDTDVAMATDGAYSQAEVCNGLNGNAHGYQVPTIVGTLPAGAVFVHENSYDRRNLPRRTSLRVAIPVLVGTSLRRHQERRRVSDTRLRMAHQTVCA